MLNTFLKWILLNSISYLAIFKVKMEPVTQEDKHGLLHEPSIPYEA